ADQELIDLPVTTLPRDGHLDLDERTPGGLGFGVGERRLEVLLEDNHVPEAAQSAERIGMLADQCSELWLADALAVGGPWHGAGLGRPPRLGLHDESVGELGGLAFLRDFLLVFLLRPGLLFLAELFFLRALFRGLLPFFLEPLPYLLLIALELLFLLFDGLGEALTYVLRPLFDRIEDVGEQTSADQHDNHRNGAENGEDFDGDAAATVGSRRTPPWAFVLVRVSVVLVPGHESHRGHLWGCWSQSSPLYPVYHWPFVNCRQPIFTR